MDSSLEHSEKVLESSEAAAVPVRDPLRGKVGVQPSAGSALAPEPSGILPRAHDWVPAHATATRRRLGLAEPEPSLICGYSTTGDPARGSFRLGQADLPPENAAGIPSFVEETPVSSENTAQRKPPSVVDTGRIGANAGRAGAVADDAQSSDDEAASETAVRWNVLLVEDDAVYTKFVTGALKRRADGGFRLQCETTLADGLRRARMLPPDIVLLDLMLPDAQGLDTLAQFRNQLPETPIVVLSSMHDNGVGMRAVQSGAQDFLCKDNVNASALHRCLQFALERHRVQQDYFALAFHDGLTGLRNRTVLTNHMERALDRQRRQHDQRFAVLLLDIDGFRLVNEGLGSDTGDQLLIEIGRRLQEAVRDQDLVARVGADEFVVFVGNVTTPHDAVVVAERLQDALKWPITLNGQSLSISASIGIVVSSPEYRSPNDLLQDAETAKDHSRERGKGRHTVFDKQMHEHVVERLRLESELKGCVQRRELLLHFQPIVDLSTGRVAAAEALLRWKHPRHGVLSPRHFLSLAEDAGATHKFTKAILDDVCKQARKWLKSGGFDDNFTVGVNVSRGQLTHDKFLPIVRRALHKSGLKPRHLQIEVSETTLLQDPAKVERVLSELHRLGVRVCLDNFGTGYSSLKNLGHIHFDAMKIDRSFVAGLDADSGTSICLTQMMARVAKQLGVTLIAVGIETELQRDLAQQLGCRYGQGHLFGAASRRDNITLAITDRAAQNGRPRAVAGR